MRGGGDLSEDEPNDYRAVDGMLVRRLIEVPISDTCASQEGNFEEFPNLLVLL
jgi:hypothetical protein